MFTKKSFWVLVIGFLNLVSVDAKERSFVMMQQLEFSRAGGYYSLIRSTIEIVSLCMQSNRNVQW